MWSDNDIDNAFQRLNPPEPEPTPLPLDAWLRLETQLDKALIERMVRQKLWRYFAAEVAVAALLALGWFLWPTQSASPAAKSVLTASAQRTTKSSSTLTGPMKRTASARISHVGGPSNALAARSATLAAAVGSAPAPPEGAEAPAAGRPGIPAAVPSSGSGSILVAVLPLEQPRRRLRRANRRAESAASRSVGLGMRVISPSKPSASFEAKPSARELAAQPNQVAVSSSLASAATKGSAHRREPGSSSNPVANSDSGLADAHARRSDAIKPRQLESEATTPVRTSVIEAPAQKMTAKTSIKPSPGTSNPAETGTPESLAAPADVAALAARSAAVQLADVPPLPAPLPTVAMADPAPATVISPRQPRFYVSLVGALDVSSVKFASVDSPLPNAGLTLEYRLTNRLRLTSGLLRSTKQYQARREDYDWDAYPNAHTRDFKWVAGNCTILDLPLNLRYDVISRPRTKVFGTMGLSTFFLQHEQYTYNYVENNRSYTWDQRFTNANQNLFSIFNLSFGYERSLSTRWSVQAEPYFKLPLAGIGAGKVQLASAGVFIGVKYGL